jgi:hypothetical protein
MNWANRGQQYIKDEEDVNVDHGLCTHPLPGQHDQNIGDQAMELDRAPVAGNDAVGHGAIGLYVELPYHTGDRTYFNNDTFQDHERKWATEQKPLEELRKWETEQDQLEELRRHFYAACDEVVKKQPTPAIPASSPAVTMVDRTEAAAQFIEDDYVNQHYSIYSPTPPLRPAIDPRLLCASSPPRHTPPPCFPPARPPTPLPAPHPLELTCNLCGSTKCNSPVSLKRHKDREHGIKVKMFYCSFPNCSKGYQSKKETDITRHENTFHRNRRLFTCPLCSKTFSRKDNYRRHLRDKEGQPDLAEQL